MNKFLLPLAACALMVSCAEEQNNAPITQGKVTFQVPDFEPEAETRIWVAINDAGASFRWQDGDTLGVFPDYGFQTAFPISAGTGTSSAEFDGGAWALRSSMQYAAYFPFQHPMDAVDKRAIAVSYKGQNQLFNNNTNGGLGEYDYLAAPYTEVNSAGNTTFSLAHMGALVRFRLTAPVADEFRYLRLTSDGTPFVTEGTIDLTAANPALTATTTNDKVKLDLSRVKTNSAEAVVTLYMMLAPADLSSSQITVLLAGSADAYECSVQGKNFVAGTVYDYEVNLINTVSLPIQDDGYYMMLMEDYDENPGWTEEVTEDEADAIVAVTDHSNVQYFGETVPSIWAISRISGFSIDYLSGYSSVTKVDEMCTDDYDVYVMTLLPNENSNKEYAFYWLLDADLPDDGNSFRMTTTVINGIPDFDSDTAGGFIKLQDSDPSHVFKNDDTYTNLLSTELAANHVKYGLTNCNVYVISGFGVTARQPNGTQIGLKIPKRQSEY